MNKLSDTHRLPWLDRAGMGLRPGLGSSEHSRRSMATLSAYGRDSAAPSSKPKEPTNSRRSMSTLWAYGPDSVAPSSSRNELWGFQYDSAAAEMREVSALLGM